MNRAPHSNGASVSPHKFSANSRDQRKLIKKIGEGVVLTPSPNQFWRLSVVITAISS